MSLESQKHAVPITADTFPQPHSFQHLLSVAALTPAVHSWHRDNGCSPTLLGTSSRYTGGKQVLGSQKWDQTPDTGLGMGTELAALRAPLGETGCKLLLVEVKPAGPGFRQRER